MEQVVCSAARRLAVLVAGALALVTVPFVAEGRVGGLPAASGALALLLLLLALVPLTRASRLLREAGRPPAHPRPAMAYRANPRGDDREPVERAATHEAAIAFLLLALAASLTVVAAASR